MNAMFFQLDHHIYHRCFFVASEMLGYQFRRHNRRPYSMTFSVVLILGLSSFGAGFACLDLTASYEARHVSSFVQDRTSLIRC